MTISLVPNISSPIVSANSIGYLGSYLGVLSNYGVIAISIIDAAIKALFANGEQGAWYDPSDLTTMFQDRAGTTPVTADGQPVGLILDKSKGLVLGSELVEYPLSGTLGASWTIVGDTIVRDGSTGTAVLASQGVVTLSTTKLHKISFNVSNLTGDSLGIRCGGGAAIGPISSNGDKTFYLSGGGAPASAITFLPWGGGAATATISNISVKEIPGNHAVAPSDAARPLYKERINLLSYSEDIAAEFSLGNVTITPNVVMAPNGTMTADQIVEGTNSNSFFSVYKPSSVPMDVASYTVSIWAKPNGRNYLILYTYGNEDGYYGKYFELIGSGAVLGDYYGAPTNATITLFPNGWYLCTMTVPKSLANSGVYFEMYLSPDGLTDIYNGDGVSGVYLWGAQVEESAEYTVYQRVEDDVYNTAGLPKWLQFDAVDDVLNTTFPSSLGSSCTVAKAVVGGSPTILTGQTIGTSWAESTDNAGVVIVNRALTGQETTDLTAWLTAKGTTA